MTGADGGSPLTDERQLRERQAYTVKEFCSCFRICQASFYNEVKRGRLRAVKLGKKTLVMVRDAEKWAAGLPSIRG